VLERRAARQLFRPSAFAELPTTAKLRTVGRVSRAANSTARCVASEFMPNIEPDAGGARQAR